MPPLRKSTGREGPASFEASFIVLRIGLGLVFLLFGIGKFRGDEWAETMRVMAFFSYLPWSVEVSVRCAGFLEVATALGLIFGLKLRWSALLAALQLVFIMTLLFFYEIKEWRDIGLLAAAIALFIKKETSWSLDNLNRKRRLKEA